MQSTHCIAGVLWSVPTVQKVWNSIASFGNDTIWQCSAPKRMRAARMNSEDEKFGILTQLYNISTILTYCQCVFVTNHFNKCIIRFYQFFGDAEVHVTMQILLLSFIFFMIIWRKMIKVAFSSIVKNITFPILFACVSGTTRRKCFYRWYAINVYPSLNLYFPT